MAGSSFFALMDDIASIMDDVAVLSKVAAKKTSGVLGDDLALNAEQVSGISASRELPVVMAVAKGSLINKMIIVPVALLLSIFLPFLVNPLLMIGGAYLCFEGVEKLWHKFFHRTSEIRQEHELHKQHLLLTEEELLKIEKDKIQGAIRTDFILSAEIIVITLGVVADFSIITRFLVLASIALIMTFGVYGLVACIVKIDDWGLYLLQRNPQSFLGKQLLLFAPWLMHFLSFAGTIAMFLVGGGIIVHGMSAIHHISAFLFQSVSFTWLKIILTSLFECMIGVFLGSLILFSIQLVKKYK